MTRLRTNQLPPDMLFDSEAKFRQAIVKKLEDAGFEVQSISVPHKLKAQLKGLGDLHIRKPSWARGLFVKAEVKLGQKWDWSDVEQEEDNAMGRFELFLWMADVDNWIEGNE